MNEKLFSHDDLFLDIYVVDEYGNKNFLPDDSSRYISESLKNYPPTKSQKDKAIRTLISYYRYYSVSYERVNISSIERSLVPTKEMTIEEIEEQLGYKVKIVKEK